MKKTIYYNSLNDDILKSKNQEYQLNSNYKWLKNDLFSKILSILLYLIIIIVTFIYSKLILHVKIKNKKILKKEKSYFIYSNHTQMLGDVLNPFLISFKNHPYIICSPSNLGIPILGRLLPLAGALPIPSNIHDLKKLNEAISYHIKKNHPIYIYPEAHLWPWATFIREFPKTSFHYPITNNSKVFVATTTYQKRKFLKKPKITIYLDGPFTSEENLSTRENIKLMHDKVYNTMLNRSELSTYNYVNYKKKTD